MDAVRIDKWLWAARFFKTRALATEEVAKGRASVNGQTVKPSRELRVGDALALRQGSITRTLTVRGLSVHRGPAPVAQQLYEESEASRLAREQALAQQRLAVDPALSLAHGRPTKRDRRQLEQARDSGYPP